MIMVYFKTYDIFEMGVLEGSPYLDFSDNNADIQKVTTRHKTSASNNLPPKYSQPAMKIKRSSSLNLFLPQSKKFMSLASVVSEFNPSFHPSPVSLLYHDSGKESGSDVVVGEGGKKSSFCPSVSPKKRNDFTGVSPDKACFIPEFVVIRDHHHPHHHSLSPRADEKRKKILFHVVPTSCSPKEDEGKLSPIVPPESTLGDKSRSKDSFKSRSSSSSSSLFSGFTTPLSIDVSPCPSATAAFPESPVRIGSSAQPVVDHQSFLNGMTGHLFPILTRKKLVSNSPTKQTNNILNKTASQSFLLDFLDGTLLRKTKQKEEVEYVSVPSYLHPPVWALSVSPIAALQSRVIFEKLTEEYEKLKKRMVFNRPSPRFARNFHHRRAISLMTTKGERKLSNYLPFPLFEMDLLSSELLFLDKKKYNKGKKKSFERNSLPQRNFSEGRNFFPKLDFLGVNKQKEKKWPEKKRLCGTGGGTGRKNSNNPGKRNKRISGNKKLRRRIDRKKSDNCKNSDISGTLQLLLQS
jgi:hypothetical protein